jgi:hypothetical protein
MTREVRAELQKMTREERAEMRRADKAMRDEVLSWKRAVSAKLNAMTTEERLAHFEEIADKCRAEGFNVVKSR